jgi:precorrin-6Y C5,15-methyltransferase (decarboxylating)
VSSIENVASVRHLLHEKTDNEQVWMINVARGVYQLDRVRFEAINPIFLIGATKK